MANYINKRNVISVLLMVFISFQAYGYGVTLAVNNTLASAALAESMSNDMGQAKGESAKKVVTGKVLEKGTNTPVTGATVYQEGTSNGTTTDLEGNFSISISEGETLSVSCIGFESQSIVIGTQAKYDIVLKEDTMLLDEAVVTGYGGKQLRSKLTNSIAKVDSEVFSVGMQTNPASSLAGAVSGLRVIQNTGDPNDVPTIILRGGTNVNGTGSPLVVVDGQIHGDMSDINSEDIESMEVLKDAGATAIYGARASNGVILITTKQGKAGHREINFKAKVGLNYFYLPWEFCDAEGYIYWMRKAFNETPWVTAKQKKYLDAATVGFGIGGTSLSESSTFNILKKTDANSYLLDKGWKTMKDPLNENVDILYKESNPASYNVNTPALSQDYNLNMSGGNDKGTYYAGLGYNSTEGLAVGAYYKRLSFVFNGSYKITDWLTSKSGVNFAYKKGRSYTATGDMKSEADYFGRVLSMPPTIRWEDEDGNLLLGSTNRDGNQLYQIDYYFRDNNNLKTTLSQSFSARIIDGLTFNLHGDWYFNQNYNEAFNKDYPTDQAETESKWNRTRASSARYNKYFYQTYNATLQYVKTFAENHNLDAMVGAEYYSRKYELLTASGSEAPTDDFRDLELTSNAEGKRSIDTEHNENRILSFFGKVNYDYAGKYLVSATFREDGYSSLLDNRWGFFPGVSAGWVFGKEDFVKNAMSVLSFGKLRASYGVNGNASGIGPYDLQGAYSAVAYDGTTGFYLSDLPNKTLRWERTNTFEVGLDLSFFHNRLNTNFTYYNRLTEDKYASQILPKTTGYSSIKNNNGKFRNEGVEIELGGKIIQSRDFRWDLNVNIAYNINRIVSLPDNGLENNRQGGTEVYTGNGYETKWVGGYQEGQVPGTFVGYIAEGIFRSEADFPANYVVTSGNAKNFAQYTPAEYAKLTTKQKASAVCLAIGDVKWKDINGDGVIDSFDQAVIGNTTPRWIGGFNTNFSWKGLRLYANFDYALGFSICESSSNVGAWYSFMGCMQGTYNMPVQVWDTVSESNPNGKYPRYVFADQNGAANYYRTSSLITYKGDYLAVREVSLSYSLPKKWMDKIKAQKIEFSVTGQNLGYLTEAKFVTNHESGGGTDSTNPLPRTVIFGVNLTF